MNNGEALSPPEFLPDREEAKLIVGTLRRALEKLHSTMQNLAPHSGMNLDDINRHCPNEYQQAKLAVDQAQGLPITGGTKLNGYYVARPDVYQRGFLPDRRGRVPNRFQGLVGPMDEVPVPGANGADGRICLVLKPLYLLRDPELSSYYVERGWQDQLRHPFAVKEHQDELIYTPVSWLVEGYNRQECIKLLDYWNPDQPKA